MHRPEGITDLVAKSGLLPWRHDQPEKTNHILRLSNAGRGVETLTASCFLQARNGF